MDAIYLIVTAFVYICAQAQIFNDDYLSDYPIYPPDSEEEAGYAKYQVQNGVDIALKCNATSCTNYNPKIVWEFKELQPDLCLTITCAKSIQDNAKVIDDQNKTCQSDFGRQPCSKIIRADGKTLVDNNTQWQHVNNKFAYRKRCKDVLELKNVTEKYSGIYRCVEKNKVTRIFELDVIDPISKYRTQPPKLLDVVPSNITVSQNLPVIIQCKVYSKQPPVIWWFKESDEFNYDIEYFDKYYSRINTSIQVYPAPQEFNVYLSKLKIYHAQEMDSGIYVCVAMTESGKDHRDVLVKVMPTTSASNWDRRTTFPLLFLIPLIFALIPATIWMCFYGKRKNTKKKPIPKRDEYVFRPINSDNNNLNGHVV